MSSDAGNIERRELYEFAGRALSLFKPNKIIDVACGNGEWSGVLGSMLGNAQVVGVDLDERLIDYAKTHFQTERVAFVRADALKLPFPDKSFDSVVSFHTIEHFNETDQVKLLRELSRVLRDYGVLVIATPDRDVWSLQGIAGIQEDHIRELNQKEFRSILRDCGFSERGVFGQCILRENDNFLLRRLLNFLKKMDVIGLRKKILRNYVRMIDGKTQPVEFDFRVQKLELSQKASITVIACNKI
jgi:ubiquinone/menaquinone biosynthesis C-methylase UbiE